MADLPDEAVPQMALEKVIGKFAFSQPWFLRLIIEDEHIREMYAAAVAEAIGEGEMSASRPATRRWTPDEECKLDELLDAGKDAAEIAVALNRTRQAVYARLQRRYRKRAKQPGWSRSG
jgi:DNA-binding NarL/FixJ family response regulator